MSNLTKNLPTNDKIIAKSDEELRNNLKFVIKALYLRAFEKKKK